MQDEEEVRKRCFPDLSNNLYKSFVSHGTNGTCSNCNLKAKSGVTYAGVMKRLFSNKNFFRFI
ncbi:hypothetical protein HNR44_001598 [Geomicrobium halophilum]|uniref:Uncharacterized protein n=1 Tax=Geomicrobium halophilum TaxID=549000 RepID=A0A841PLH8_9BACL|nr:hypothetical protein [Geomicrobium halophilum]